MSFGKHSMPFKYIPEIATADIAFEATGKNLNGLFESCAMAVEDTMVETKGIKTNVSKEIKLSDKELEKLLFDFLNELVYMKDADLLLFSKVKCSIKESKGKYSLVAVLKGEKIDTKRHELRNDIKAVTWHMFKIEKIRTGYKALIIVDV